MRQIREVLRQKWGLGLSNRQIARGCGISRPTVAEYLRRAKAAGLSWPLSSELDDAELERKLFPPALAIPSAQRAMPEWIIGTHRYFALKDDQANSIISEVSDRLRGWQNTARRMSMSAADIGVYETAFLIK